MSQPVALVTGASSGIGESVVRRLLRDGWTVYGAARRLERMSGIQSAGAKILRLDVTSEESLRAAVDALLAAEGRLDALVNNAGYGSYGALEEVPPDEARRQFDVNVFGLVRLTQLVLPPMRQAGRGTIVNITSMGGRIYFPFGGWYHATKHALEVLSDVLRVELRPFGVRVVVVQPGSIRTEWSGIAAAGLRERSGGGPYAAAIDPWARVMENPQHGSPPEAVANVVSKAVNARRPRRRYAVPADAKALILLKRWLPDWAWERFTSIGIRIAAARA